MYTDFSPGFCLFYKVGMESHLFAEKIHNKIQNKTKKDKTNDMHSIRIM